MRFNSSGSAAYGYGPTVAIDGSIPAALSGQVNGNFGGPAWISSTQILYQNGGTGSGPWIVQSYDTGTLSTATVSSSGASRIGAGNGIWAAFLASNPTSLRTSIGGFGPFSNVGLADVSSLGQIVTINSYSSGVGLTVYDSTGAQQITLPSVSTVGTLIRLIGNVLAYQSTTGWHLAPVSTNTTRFAPRLDPIAGTIAVPLSDGKIVVIETSNSQLTARFSDQAKGYVVENAPDTFWPDAMEISPGVVRIGWATNQGESVTSAVYVDLTMSSGANTRATISGGAFVPVVQTPLSQTTFSVGPIELNGGDADVGARYPPYQHPVMDKSTGLVTKPWMDFFTAMKGDSFSTQVAVSKIPPPAPVNAFTTIAESGQPSMVAVGSATLTLAEGPGQQIALNPFTNTATFSTRTANFPPMLSEDRTEWWPIPFGSAAASSSASVIPLTTTLTNAQIKALPTTGVTLIAAPGSNKRVKFLALSVLLHNSDGVYTGLDATFAALQVTEVGNTDWLAVPIVNDGTVPVTQLTDFMTTFTEVIVDLVVPDHSASVNWLLMDLVSSPNYNNAAIQISIDNNGAGNLGGGHVNNSMIVRGLYVLEDLS